MTQAARFILAGALFTLVLGCGGGPQPTTKTDEELKASTADPSKLLVPAEVDPAKPPPTPATP